MPNNGHWILLPGFEGVRGLIIGWECPVNLGFIPEDLTSYFTSENALIKLIYCACQKVLEKSNQPIHNWALIMSQLPIYFEDILNMGLR